MSLAENVRALPQPLSGNYEVARFNALRHGVLSQHTVLPWEDRQEYLTLLRTRLESVRKMILDDRELD